MSYNLSDDDEFFDIPHMVDEANRKDDHARIGNELLADVSSLLISEVEHVTEPIAFNYDTDEECLNFPFVKIKNLKEKSFLIKRDKKTQFINDIAAYESSEDYELPKMIPAKLCRENLNFDSPLQNKEFIRKLNLGNTPFTQSFKNSPISKAYDSPKASIFFHPFTPEPIDKLSLSGFASCDNVGKLISFRYPDVSTTSKDKLSAEEYSTQIRKLFTNFFYLNERSIILKIIDQNQYDRFNQDGILNDKYISGYNSFHLFATFDEVIQMESYANITYHRARNRFDNKLYCIKAGGYNEFDNMRSLSKPNRLLHNEVLILSCLKHEHIVRYYSSWIEHQALYVQIEYVEGGNLESALIGTRNNLLEIRRLLISPAKLMVFEIASALDYLHSKWQYLHNDISTFNILLFPRDSAHYYVNGDWILDSLFKNKCECHLLFKLGGFEKSSPQENDEQCKKDVSDLASITAAAMGEKSSKWAYTSPSKMIKMGLDNIFTQTLMEAVIGEIASAKDLMHLLIK